MTLGGQDFNLCKATYTCNCMRVVNNKILNDNTTDLHSVEVKSVADATR